MWVRSQILAAAWEGRQPPASADAFPGAWLQMGEAAAQGRGEPAQMGVGGQHAEKPRQSQVPRQTLMVRAAGWVTFLGTGKLGVEALPVE